MVNRRSIRMVLQKRAVKKVKQNFKDGEKTVIRMVFENGQLEEEKKLKDGKRDGTGDDRVIRWKEID